MRQGVVQTDTMPTSMPLEVGDVAAADLVVALRDHFGLPPDDPPPRHDVPAHVPADLAVRVDLRGLIAWAVLGLRLLGGSMPLRELLEEVRAFAAVAAMRRARGNRVRAAGALGMNRRRLTHLLDLHREAHEGTRVVAVERFDSSTVWIYGRGLYLGKARPPNGTLTRLGPVTDDWPLGFTVPEIVLDDGVVVWGPQCTWMTEDEFAERHAGRAVEIVPPP